jgi:predicted helicase
LIDVMQARGRQQDLGGSRHGLWMGTDGLNARFIERGVDIKSFQHGIFKEHTDQRFLELVRDWCEATLRVQTPPSPEASMECDYEPRSAQERQLRGWRTFLTDNWNVIQSSTERSARAQMSMWCGTGKTFTAFLMIREFIDRYTARVTNEAATIIYFVPSLWLMGQTYKSFCCQCIRNQIEHWNWVLIGSDIDRQTTQGTETAFELQLSTKIDGISDHLKKRRPDGHNIIISTYNSWNKCAGALKKVQLRPDLVIYDEAHRTAGNIALDSFKQCILDEHFPCRVRLFMTATPKDVMIGDGELGDNEFRRDIVNSMDDPERYGELIADQYTQADAADAGDIVKSKVIALMTDVISCRLR